MKKPWLEGHQFKKMPPNMEQVHKLIDAQLDKVEELLPPPGGPPQGGLEFAKRLQAFLSGTDAPVPFRHHAKMEKLAQKKSSMTSEAYERLARHVAKEGFGWLSEWNNHMMALRLRNIELRVQTLQFRNDACSTAPHG